jgi:hypothetical protein
MSMKKMFSGALAIGALLLAVGFTAPAQAQDAPKPEAAAAAAAPLLPLRLRPAELPPRPLLHLLPRPLLLPHRRRCPTRATPPG